MAPRHEFFQAIKAYNSEQIKALQKTNNFDLLARPNAALDWLSGGGGYKDSLLGFAISKFVNDVNNTNAQAILKLMIELTLDYGTSHGKTAQAVHGLMQSEIDQVLNDKKHLANKVAVKAVCVTALCDVLHSYEASHPPTDEKPVVVHMGDIGTTHHDGQ